MNSGNCLVVGICCLTTIHLTHQGQFSEKRSGIKHEGEADQVERCGHADQRPHGGNPVALLDDHRTDYDARSHEADESQDQERHGCSVRTHDSSLRGLSE